MKRILNIFAVMLGIATPPPPQRSGRWRFS
jgi:hypothetical protein